MSCIRRIVTFGLTVAVAGLFGSNTVQAAEFEWRLDEHLVETRRSAKFTGQFADRVNEKSGGRLKLEVYYGESLGIKQQDKLRALKAGSIEMGTLYAGYFGRDAPDLQMALVQGVILNRDEMVSILPTLTEIYRDYYGKKWDIEIVGFYMGEVYAMSIMCKDKVQTLDELRKKKLRVWSKDQVDTFEKLGVAAQIIGQNDLYLGIQTGVVDCAVYVVANATTISLQEVTDYASFLHVYSNLPSAIGVNKGYWNKLPPDLQQVVREAGEWVWQQALAIAQDTSREENAKKEFTEAGLLTILEPFPMEDRKALYRAASEMWKARAEKIGGDALIYREKVMKALEKARGG